MFYKIVNICNKCVSKINPPYGGCTPGGGVGWRPETYIFKALDELMLSSN